MMKTELARQYEAKAQPGESPRTRSMALLEAYYHGCQYDGLPRAWHEDLDNAGQPIPFVQRRPSTKIPIGRMIVNIYVRALWGAGRRPKATLAGGDAEANAYVDDIIAEAKLYRAMTDATRRALSIGTGLVVWKIDEGQLRTDVWDAKYAEATFQPGRFPELVRLDYRYKYTREIRDAETGRIQATEFWHRETLDATSWTLYEDEPVTAATVPTWRPREPLIHGLGFVPAVWFALGERGVHDFDGTGVYAPYTDLIDEINRTASQVGRALYTNLDPQAVITGADERDVETMLKIGRNTWCLPEKGDAKLLESEGKFVEHGHRRVDELTKAIFNAAGIVLPDPERVSGAQSGASLELLAAPQIAAVDALREDVGDAFIRLLEQVLNALRSPALAPDKSRVDVRDGKPRKLADLGRVVLSWGAHFPVTPSDAQTASDAVTKATSAGVLSRRAGAAYVAKYFGVEDVEADQQLVETEEQRQDKRVTELQSRQAVADHLRFADLSGDDAGGDDAGGDVDQGDGG